MPKKQFVVHPVRFTQKRILGNGHTSYSGYCQYCSSPADRLRKHKTLDGSIVWLCDGCVERSYSRSWYAKHPEHFQKKNKSLNQRFIHAKCMARYRGIAWELTKEQYQHLISQPCFYGKDHTAGETNIGLDRLDHRKGYTIVNSVSCCAFHNGQKGHLECIGFTYPRTVELVFELNQKAKI